MEKFTRIVAILVAFHLTAHAQVDFRKLDAYYAEALKAWDVPGMSIAIVKDGEVVFSKGYGVKELGKRGTPDDNTLFAIASNSKAFTTAVIAQLVEEGKLGWNDKVKDHLSYFELYDPWVSNAVTIRDLLSHRVGLGTFSGDILWYRTTLSAEEIVRRVKHLPKAYDFRSGYGYSNVMYITAGEVIRKVTGKSWGENVRERFFEPLGMTRSITTSKAIEAKGNAATPHALIDGEHKPISWEDWETVGATGGVISSVKDLSQWMIFNLDHGVWKGDTLLSPQSRNMVWTPHNMFGVNHTDGDQTTHLRGYGLGWGIRDYHGRMWISHTGGYPGMLSTVVLIPDEKLGVVILTNGMRSVFGPLARYTVDAFLDVPEKDWAAEALESLNARKDTRIEERKEARVLGTRPTHDLDAYVGTYVADAYGKIIVKEDSGKLAIEFEHTPDLNATLEHWHYDVWQIHWKKPEPLTWFPFGTVQFELDNNNKVTGISFDVPNNDFWFYEINPTKVD